MRINGKPIVNATEALAFSVTDADIKKGQVKDPHRCAAAIAARREINANVVSVHVYRQRVFVEYPDRVVRYQTPAPLRTETIAFDRGGRLAASDYQLLPLTVRRDIPNGHRQGSNAPGARDAGSKDRTPKKKRPPVHVVTDARPTAGTDTQLGLQRGHYPPARRKVKR